MKAALLALLAALLSAGERAPQTDTRAEGAAQDVITVVNDRLPDAPPGERMAWARVLFTWSRFESSWLADPRGWNDDRAACGVLQVHWPQKWVVGATCKRVRADRRLGYRVGLEVMLAMQVKCGSRALALGAFSSDGTCQSIALVARRCRLAGLSSTCEATP